MIYIAAHKKFNMTEMPGYVPIQVGAHGKKDLGYIRDDSGDNISEKNPNFCELTGLYWIWKNKGDEYKGLVHYRRYFAKGYWKNDLKKIYTYEELVEKLQEKDIILSYVEHFKQNARDELLRECCTEEIFESMRNTVEKISPDYLDSFDEYFNQNRSVLFNMMFCRKEIFDAYCEWLFSILFELEKHVDINSLNDYQKRLYGFLSERLLNVWVKKNHLKVFNSNILHTEMPMIEKIKLKRRRITNEIAFSIQKS